VKSIDLNVSIHPDNPAVMEDAVTFECGASRAQAADPDLYVYEHHGEGFGQVDPGALTSFFEDLVLGRPLPTKFVTRNIQDVDTILAMTLFLQRDLAIAPVMPGLVYAVDLVHRRGLPMLAHVDRDLGLFLRFLRLTLPDKATGEELGRGVQSAVGLVRDYVLEGRFPDTQFAWPVVRVLETGTTGFVMATVDPPLLLEGWVELFRQGYLRGFLVGPDRDGCRTVLAARKSVFTPFGLEQAGSLLNELEQACGSSGRWRSDGDWLWGPPEGTRIRVSDLLQVFIRV
jgi:hypothetical protein